MKNNPHLEVRMPIRFLLPRMIPAAALALLVLLAVCQARAADEGKPLLDFRQIVLGNGMRVITLEDFSSPVVDVQVWYHVGSKDENPERQGFAHMFEHMMFRGTDRLGPTAHFDLIRRAGGYCNGSTGFDRTNYIETLPANQLELALWLEAERMAFLKIDQESFDTERKIVEEERRLGLNGSYGSLYEKGMAELFKVHPYRWTPIGNIPMLRASEVKELRAFWMLYYAPNNATMTIVGAVHHADAQALARKYFEWIPAGADVPRVTVKEPLPTEARSVTIPEKNAPTPLVGVAFRSVPLAHKDRLALDLLATILGEGTSSRLYRSMVADGRIAVGVTAANENMEQDGVFVAGAALPPVGADLPKARAALEEQIALIRKEKVTDHELIKARNAVLRGMVSACLSVHEKARMLAQAAVTEGDANRANAVLDEMRKVTADDILRVARMYLAPERALNVTIEQNVLGKVKGLISASSKSSEESAPITAKREEVAPPPGRPGLTRPADFPKDPPLAKAGDLKFTLDHFEKVLPNGLKVIVVSDHRAPFVNVNLDLRTGAWTEAKPGACSMALRMLTKGTAGHTEAQLSDELETYAISLQGAGGMDSSRVNSSCLTEHLDRTMGLLAEAALHPTFPAEEFEKLRKQVRASLAISENNPGYQAERELRRRLFGDHPYSREDTGTAADVDALKVDDLKGWWTTFARPDQAVLIFAGDVTPEHALELAQKAFGPDAWMAATPEPPKVALPPLPDRSPTHIYLVDRPGSIQSELRVAQLSITRKSPLYFTTRMVDGYFGRGFGARLNKSLRVDKGLTYGISGGMSPMRMAGRFMISTFSKTDSTPQALRAILDEIKRLRVDKPSDAEMSETLSYMVGGFATSHQTPMQIADDLWLLEQEQLPADWFQQLLAKVATVTADECLAAVNQTIDESTLVIVITGDAEKLKKDMEAIAPVTVIEAAGKASSAPASAPSKP
jgi:zinc protease